MAHLRQTLIHSSSQSVVDFLYDILSRCAPTAQSLAELSTDDLSGLGITGTRITTILALARAIASGFVSLEPGQDVEQTSARLKTLPGIGDWTTEYIAMRALSWPDAFPYSDLGIKKALNLKSDKQIIAYAERYRPWRSYAAMHLWKSLEKVNDDSILLQNR